MGDKRRPADELENAPTRSHPQGSDAVPPLPRELARTPEVFAGSLARGLPLLGKRYTIERLIGEGGMGAVYLAIDEVLGKEVALKLVDARFAGDLERIRDEVLLAQEVSHRNVCRTYDLEEFEGHWLVKMEYIDGRTLADKVTAVGPLSVAEARAIARQIAHGLAAAHERGVVHRDLKPQNILVENDSNRVVLMDFGLARLAELAGQTAEGVVGTPEYMAPEQARGREVDGRADLYALGCVLYHMLTGKVVFPAETAMAAALRHAEDPPPDPRAARSDIPSWLAQLILRLLEKDPARRPADAASVAAALAGPRRRWRLVAMLAVLAATTASALALAVAALRWSAGPSPPVPEPPIAQAAVPDAPMARAAAPDAAGLAAAGPAPEVHPTFTDEGLLLNLTLPQAPDEILVKLPGDTDFHSTGMHPDLVDSATRAPLAKTWIILPRDAPATKVQVKYRRGSQWSGPFELAVDPEAVALREAKQALQAFPRWVEIGERDRRRTVSFELLGPYRSGIRSIQYGFDEDLPSRTLAEGDTRQPVPRGAHFVSVQVTFRDGTRSEVQRMEIGKTGEATAKPTGRLETGIPECDSVLTGVAACYKKMMLPDAYRQTLNGLRNTAATLRENLATGTPRAEVIQTCETMRETYRRSGCDL